MVPPLSSGHPDREIFAIAVFRPYTRPVPIDEVLCVHRVAIRKIVDIYDQGSFFDFHVLSRIFVFDFLTAKVYTIQPRFRAFQCSSPSRQPLVAASCSHAHANWPQEGMKLARLSRTRQTAKTSRRNSVTWLEPALVINSVVPVA